MVLSRSLAGANSGCSFKVDSYQCIAFSNSSCEDGKKNTTVILKEICLKVQKKPCLFYYKKNTCKRRVTNDWIFYHCNIDVGEGKVVHNKVRCNLYSHASDGKGVLPQPSVLKDVGQADKWYILFHD